MLVRLRHTLGFISLIAVYAPTEVSVPEEKDLFYAKLDSVVEQCPSRDSLIVLGDFNAVTGTERAGYELCVGPHGSGDRNVNGSLLLDFAKFRRLRIGGSWFQRREPRRWTWYSNAGGVAKEIDHILVSTRWRILQNCRVYRSAGAVSSSTFTSEIYLQVGDFTIKVNPHRLLKVANLHLLLSACKLDGGLARHASNFYQ